MEETLVNDIKRLRVLTPSDHDNMDDLTPDTNIQTVASATPKNKNKSILDGRKNERVKRKIKNSTTKSFLKLSDESESSLDEVIYCPSVRYASHSDSEDFRNVWCEQKLNAWRTSTVPIVESDSVNENFHPIREQKRKRKFKRMAVDSPSNAEHDDSTKWLPSKAECKHYQNQHFSRNALKTPLDDHHYSAESVWKKFLDYPESFCGKRKRSIREKSSDCSSADKRANFNVNRVISSSDVSSKWVKHGYLMEYDGIRHSPHRDPSSSGSSSSDSECGILTNDEGREADDEQSDCFHESTSPTGILIDELLPESINALRKRFEYITSYEPRFSHFKKTAGGHKKKNQHKN